MAHSTLTEIYYRERSSMNGRRWEISRVPVLQTVPDAETIMLARCVSNFCYRKRRCLEFRIVLHPVFVVREACDRVTPFLIAHHREVGVARRRGAGDKGIGILKPESSIRTPERIWCLRSGSLTSIHRFLNRLWLGS